MPQHVAFLGKSTLSEAHTSVLTCEFTGSIICTLSSSIYFVGSFKARYRRGRGLREVACIHRLTTSGDREETGTGQGLDVEPRSGLCCRVLCRRPCSRGAARIEDGTAARQVCEPWTRTSALSPRRSASRRQHSSEYSWASMDAGRRARRSRPPAKVGGCPSWAI